MTSGSRGKMVSTNLRFGLAIVCFFVGFTSTFAVSFEDPPSIAEDDWSCTLDFSSQNLGCTWPPQIVNSEHSVVELLYRTVQECHGNVSKVSCGTEPPCYITDIRRFLCHYYNVSLKVNYTTSGVPVSFVLPWKKFYLPSIIKYPPLTVEVKDVNKTCITLEWTQNEMDSEFDIIQFEYISQWERSKVETSNITINRPPPLGLFSPPYQPKRKHLCGLTPSTQYTISVRIRPSTSHVWSDDYTINENTNDSVPARSPLTISSAFMRFPSNATIILYWKLLSDKEWQSAPVEGGYYLSVRNASTEEWQQLAWDVSQTEISLFKEQDTIIKLQAYNLNGYAENYTEITIPFSGPPEPASVTAVINETEKEVRFSWDSEFNEEVVLFWCLWGNGYQCRKNSFDWKRLKDFSSNSATMNIEEVDPSSHYMFGVSVSHLNISSGIKWTRCIDDQEVYRSSCNSSLSLINAVNGNKTPKTIVIISATFGTLLMVGVILAIVLWYTLKWRRKAKDLKPVSKLHQAKSDVDAPCGERDGHPPSKKTHEKNCEEVKGIDKLSESTVSTNDPENCPYHRIGQETSVIVIKEIDSEEVNNSGNKNRKSDDSSGNSSDFSGNSLSSGYSDENESKGSDDHLAYTLRHQHIDEDSGTSSASEFWHLNFKTDNTNNQMGEITAEEDEDSGDVSHCPRQTTTEGDSGDVSHHTRKTFSEEDDDNGDVSLHHMRKTTAEEDEDSDDDSHYQTRKTTAAEGEDSDDASHYRTRNTTAEEDEDSDDDSHYQTRKTTAAEGEDSDDASHYRTRNTTAEENEDSGDISHHIRKTTAEEDEDSSDVSHYR